MSGGTSDKTSRRSFRKNHSLCEGRVPAKGYSDASLRTIAEKAGTTTGSIYSRFKDKEGLFSAIVEPAADHLVQMFLHTQETFHGLEEEQQPKEMKHYVSSGMVEMIDYIYDNFEVFELLLDASYGTKFQDFVERLVEIETEYTYKYMDVIHYRTEDGEDDHRGFYPYHDEGII